MSVFTTVQKAALKQWLADCNVGELIAFEGIAAGIQNTNYFVSTTHGEFVLTLFESVDLERLPFYLQVMAGLSAAQIACPQPIAHLDGSVIRTLQERPASLLTRLPGKAIAEPKPQHCAQIGAWLARMHLALDAVPWGLDNDRDSAWRSKTAYHVLPHLNAAQQALLADYLPIEKQYQSTIRKLPQGVIHGDLFRDNALFSKNSLGGVIDFYFSGVDSWAYDLAIVANDWCADASGKLDGERLASLLEAYQALRIFTPTEEKHWRVLLVLAAARFWLSRLFDLHFPRPGELTHAKDPAAFETILRARLKNL